MTASHAYDWARLVAIVDRGKCSTYGRTLNLVKGDSIVITLKDGSEHHAAYGFESGAYLYVNGIEEIHVNNIKTVRLV